MNAGILIVDASLPFIESMQNYLASTGEQITIQQAQSATDALTFLSESSPTVCLLNDNVSNNTSIDLLSILKKEHPSTVIIMLTDHQGEDLLQYSFKPGVHFSFNKTIDLNSIKETIMRML
ncbi:MAG: response regulator [Bacteroidota bacterium]